MSPLSPPTASRPSRSRSKEEAFDVVVTDLMMPGLSGDELARRLRQDEPKLKVLDPTGHSDRLFMEKATLWQDESFLEKPCTVKGLKEAVALLFFGASKRRRLALTSAGVHLEMRILAKSPERNEGTPVVQREPGFGAAIVATLPAGGDQLRSLRAGAPPQGGAQVDSARGVEAQVPHAVGGQPAAIAAAAERIGRGRDDAEHGAIRQPEPIGRRRRISPRSAESARSGPPADRASPCARRRAAADQRVAPPTSMYSMNRTSAFTVFPYSIRSISSSSLTPLMTTVSILRRPKTRCAASMPSFTRARSSKRVRARNRSGLRVSRLTVTRRGRRP